MANTNQTQYEVKSNQPQIQKQPAFTSCHSLTATRLPRLAVLIDAENAPTGIIKGLFGIVFEYGRAYVRRAYGNWTPSLRGKWQKILQTYSITPVQQSPYVKNKSVTDMGMIIDAMDLLHGRKLDAFCLVSSDSDFACLATRIQAEGLPVLGFGEEKAPNSYMQTYDRFFIWKGGTKFQTRQQYWQSDGQLVQDVRDALAQAKSHDGWVHMSLLDSLLREKPFLMTPKQHGYSGWSALLKDMEEFEIQVRNGNGSIYVREKLRGQNGTGPANGIPQ